MHKYVCLFSKKSKSLHSGAEEFVGTMKVLVPRDIRQTHGYVIDKERLPSGAKADLTLRLKGDIPERMQYGGTEKPGDYIFSASAKLTKFGKTLTLNRYSNDR